MREMFDAMLRALGYCLHPRVLLWSLAPLALAGGGLALLGWAFWEDAVAAVRTLLERWDVLNMLLDWLALHGAAQLRVVLAPLIVVMLTVPLAVVVTLLLVSAVVTPAVVRLVAARRFPTLERRQGAGFVQSLLWALACTLAALAALVCSLPLWLVPPLALLLPALVWGWLTCRVLAFDTLALHASAVERRLLLRRRRWPLLAMGIVCGLLGAVPSLLWAVGAAALIFAPILLVVSVWLYTVVFAFAACWFAHYLLAALERLRDTPVPPSETPAPALDAVHA
ncbi:MAG: EI24 domain-containing protein [Burkholderiales bacterium]|nr:EI24 domain-containing protein [Burkholderiales bacterium]